MKLSNEEIQELIIEYQSKVRKAEFQLAEYRKSVQDLEKALLKPRSQRALGSKRTASGSITNTSKSAAPKRRGRPRKKAAAKTATTAATASPAKKKRGRPAKKATTGTGRKPGRPRKSTTTAKATGTKTAAKTTRKRGRPPKKATAAKATTATKTTRKRGRPAKKTTAAKAATTTKTTRKRGRPAKKTTAAKAATTTKTTRKRGRPAKKTAAKAGKKATRTTTRAKGKTGAKKGGYRLNEWDELVLQTLNDRQKVSVFSDFHEKATTKAKAEGRSIDEKTLYSRINQSLHKLANKRDVLVKVPHEGRGFAYGLKEWKSPAGKGVQQKFQ